MRIHARGISAKTKIEGGILSKRMATGAGFIITLAIALLLLCRFDAHAAQDETTAQRGEQLTPAELANEAAKPPTQYSNVQYGPHPRNVLDFWQVESDRPTPVVLFFHGGSFHVGDKRELRAERLNSLLESGVSVASVNYRLVHTHPLPAALYDGARAVQFLRFKAEEWNIDRAKVGAYGHSAGACIAMWVGFHDDLAKPNSEDPIERESSRLFCVGSLRGQSSNDPRWMARWFSDDAPLRDQRMLRMFGVQTVADLEKPQVRKMIEEASPINHVTEDDPPVYMGYRIRDFGEVVPIAGNHHPVFGIRLKQVVEALGIEAVLTFLDRENPSDPYRSVENFFKAKFSTTM